MYIQRINTVNFCSAQRKVMEFTAKEARSILKDAPRLRKLGESLYAEMRTGKLNQDIPVVQTVQPKIVKIKRSDVPLRRTPQRLLPCTI